MRKKVLFLIGAGSTYAEASGGAEHNRPPLDHNFFSLSEKVHPKDTRKIAKFVQENYSVDVFDKGADRLESIMAMIYADVFHPKLGESVFETFGRLIRLYNRRIAQTTNKLEPNNKSLLFKMIAQYLPQIDSLDDLTFVTFNQDIHIERTLARFFTYKTYKKYGQILQFPDCYKIDCKDFTSPTSSTVSQFQSVDGSVSGPRILKLHGSLNWLSSHNSPNIKKGPFFNSERSLKITNRAKLPESLNLKGEKKTTYGLPIVVPPVLNKASILHERLRPIWSEAESAITSATEIVIYGYSCPLSDVESSNMIRKGVSANNMLRSISVIDPNSAVISRYLDILDKGYLSYYKDANHFLRAN